MTKSTQSRSHGRKNAPSRAKAPKGNDRPLAAHLDALVSALAAEGIALRRSQALKVAARIGGYRNQNELAEALATGGHEPPAAEAVGIVTCAGAPRMAILRDPVTSLAFGVEADRLGAGPRATAHATTPYGTLVSLHAVDAASIRTLGSAVADGASIVRVHTTILTHANGCEGPTFSATTRERMRGEYATWCRRELAERHHEERGLLEVEADDDVIDNYHERTEAGAVEGTCDVEVVAPTARGGGRMHRGLVAYDGGTVPFASPTMAGLMKGVADWCRKYWHELPPSAGDADADDEEAVRVYFENQQGESLDVWEDAGPSDGERALPGVEVPVHVAHARVGGEGMGDAFREEAAMWAWLAGLVPDGAGPWGTSDQERVTGYFGSSVAYDAEDTFETYQTSLAIGATQAPEVPTAPTAGEVTVHLYRAEAPHGDDDFASVDQGVALGKLAASCRSRWVRAVGDDVPVPGADQEVVDTFFEAVGDESYTHAEITVPLVASLPDPEPLPFGKPDDGSRVIARFVAQAWQNDYAIDCDPEGDVEWDVTEHYDAMDALALARAIPAEERDELQNTARAPRWVREWSGPFEVRTSGLRSYARRRADKLPDAEREALLEAI